MTLNYDNKVVNGIDGYYFTPNGELFTLDDLSKRKINNKETMPTILKILKDFLIFEHIFEDKVQLIYNLFMYEKNVKSNYSNLSATEQKLILEMINYLLQHYKRRKTVSTKEQKYNVNEVFKSMLVQSCNYDYVVGNNSKIITTSKFNIYETFYNYILMEFDIHQIPKRIYDDDERGYVEYSQCKFFIPESELRLKSEIESIKKYVPKKQRQEFFRTN